MVKTNYVSICIISEPKSSGENLKALAKFLGFNNSSYGSCLQSKLWIMWKDNFIVNVLWEHQQHLTVKVESSSTSQTFVVSGIYAGTNIIEKQDLWRDLVNISHHIQIPWLLMGDYNAILNWHEKQGGDQRDDGTMAGFNNFILQAGLVDAGYNGSSFTWCNNQSGEDRIYERLDRVLLNGEALVAIPNIKVMHLEKVCSDHSPLVISFNDEVKRKSSFKFLKMWTQHPNFMQVVQDSWNQNQGGAPLTLFANKLKHLKNVLKDWNWRVFGDVNLKIVALKSKIADLDHIVVHNWSDESFSELKECKEDLIKFNNFHLAMMEEKSRLNWVKGGDRNSKVFHAAIKAQRIKNKFHLQRGDGSFSDNPEEIANAAVHHFQQFLGTFPSTSHINLDIPTKRLVTDTENSLLCSIPEEEEIKKTVLDLKSDSAPGPDGFSGHFYQCCWSIIKTDLVNAVQDFFKGAELPRSISSTNMVLIPKVPDACRLDQLRPISLCNVIHKIITKLMNDRIANMMPELISVEQSGFIRGRCIHENIGLAQDLTQYINKDVPGGNIILKIDMEKAYDKISWRFILKMLQHYGFSNSWCDLIFRAISNCWYSIIWEGQAYGYFKSNRGVRQGDPLSPTIFVLAMEYLSLALNKAMSEGTITHYSTVARAIKISHLMYADDLLIFSNGDISSVTNLVEILNDFCTMSGQSISHQKSSIVFSSLIPDNEVTDILNITKFSQQCLPMKYLGAMIYQGRVNADIFHYLEEAVQSRISGWAKTFISMAGRVTIIQAVLNALSLHAMAALPVPKKTIKRIQSLIVNFLWDSGKESRHHWIAWPKLCFPKEEGGLGLRSLLDFKKALMAKLAWKFLTKSCLWMDFVHSKIKRNRVEYDSFIWRHIRPFVTELREASRWEIHEGNISIGRLSNWFNTTFPNSHAQMSIREFHEGIDQFQDTFQDQIQALDPVLQGITFSGGKDKLVWTVSSSGIFSTKEYYEHTRLHNPKLPWFQHIWQAWIPPKMSVLVWKILHRKLATDDCISSKGIFIVSKCQCCYPHNVETLDHVFFKGHSAAFMWKFLSNLFNKPAPNSSSELCHNWLNQLNKKNFISCVTVLASVVTLWELWIYRNKRKMENEKRNIFVMVQTWMGKLSFLIPGRFGDQHQVDKICRAFQIKAPQMKGLSTMLELWCPWPWGITCSTHIVKKNDEYFCGSIFRDSHSNFIFASCVKLSGDCIFDGLLASFHSFPFATSIITNVQGCHEEFDELDRIKVPWIKLRQWRRLQHLSPKMVSSSVSLQQVNSAMVLAYSGIVLAANQMTNLPTSVINAILHDSQIFQSYHSLHGT